MPVADIEAAVRRELRTALWIVFALLLIGLVGGVVWALLAPTEKVLVVTPDGGAALTGESNHHFDALAIFAGLGMLIGLLTAAACWRVRALRGPAMPIALVLGSVIGGALMGWFGEQVARWLHPRSHHPPLHTVVEMAPTIQGWAVLVLQPMVAALVIAVLVAFSRSEDLGHGARLPADAESGSGAPEVGAPASYQDAGR
ncbi:MAG: DUF2567 domain-containing protein [Nocardia sp.]|nr:DUF2567 domain-containing protein [Nocardia sp.]